MKFDRQQLFSHYRRSFGKLSQEQVKALTFLLDQIELDPWQKDVRHVAYMLATIKHETAETYLPIKEYRARVGSKGRANQDRYWLTGYYGRGYVQLTWEGNYRHAAKRIGVDLVNNPDLAMQPKYAYEIAAAGMREGWFTGKKLSTYIHGEKCDYINARKIINGTDKAELIARYASTFEAILRASVVSGETSRQEGVTTDEGRNLDEQPSLPDSAPRTSEDDMSTFDRLKEGLVNEVKGEAISRAQDVIKIPAIPPLPIKLPGSVKGMLGGTGGILGALALVAGWFNDNPQLVATVVTLAKWLIAGGAAVGVAGVVGLVYLRAESIRAANLLNIARLNNRANGETANVEFHGWKDSQDIEGV